MKFPFKEIDWGQDFAKGDEKLKNYFVDFPEFKEVQSGAKRYIIGRKGSGKTAAIEKLRLDHEQDALKFYADITLRNFPINDLADLGDKSFADKSKHVSTWLFIIYVEIAKIISKDNGATPLSAVEELRDFIEANDLNSDVGFISTVEKLKSNNAKLSVLPKWIGGEFEAGRENVVKISVHFHKIVTCLSALISNVKTESEYWIFIDELDEGYRAGDKRIRFILLSLIRAIEDSVVYLRKNYLKFRPLLVLRSDIFDALEDNDLNKLDDYVVRLRWVSQDLSSEHSLMRVAEKRIQATYPELNKDIWETVVNNDDSDLPPGVESLWAYITSRTFDRPRDLIKFLKYSKKRVTSAEMLSFRQVFQAEQDYSAWFQNEIRDEIHSSLPMWQQCLQAISRIGVGRFALGVLIDELDNDKKIVQWMSANNVSTDEIVDLLFDFGIVGYLDGSRWIFKHKDDDLTRNKSADLIVHYGLYKKLRLKHGIKK